MNNTTARVVRDQQVTRHRVVLAILLALCAGFLAPPSASAAGAPPRATVISPAPGSDTVPAPVTLQVRADDADDANLQTTFHAQARTTGAPNPNDPFTFAVIPDTQNYVSTGANAPIMGVQTQWLVDQRRSLNLSFVTHLGDIVGLANNRTQWDRASQYQATLDAAGVPNTVLPGNHDFDMTTGAGALYQEYFPPARYATASWNSPAARYGGYLGDNQFGPDPIDRKNMDNYALFSAGGLDFLLINLEFNAPDYAIDWAKKVLAAYPSRRAILATHSYVDYLGALTPQMNRADGGNSGRDIWTKLVEPNCSIFLVVNGHFHNGDLGEARRTDTNACGGTVHGILSDYQSRANGGDGWLRYYTFVPAENRVRAYTYSPTLQRYEQDADSQFSFDLDLTLPGDYPAIGTATVPAGGTASVSAPSVPPGTTVDWYVTVSDGTTTTRSQTWSYTTAPAGPVPLARDTFSRAATASWGRAERGGTWTLAGGNSRFSVAGGTGQMAIEPGRTVSAALPDLAAASSDLRTSVALDRRAGDTYLTVSGRLIGNADYGARVKVSASGAVHLHTERSGTLLQGLMIPNLTYVAGQQLKVRVQVEGSSPTVLRAKVWRDGTAEPSAWQVSSSDATAGLQSAGGVRLQTYVSSSTTGGVLPVRWDDLDAAAMGGEEPPPTNTPPTAAFVAATSDLTVSTDSSTSADPDGSITSRLWDFGDGATATGVTASHRYAAAGTYPVKLTVVDDDGASASVTRQVTVTQPPVPNRPPVASFTVATSGRTVNLDSSGSTDPDGTIASRSWDLGDGRTGTGSTTSHTYSADGTYTVRLTVTDDDGESASTSRDVVVADTPPAPETIVSDTFTRTVSNGWGAADLGGNWSVTGPASRYSVSGGSGSLAVPAGTTLNTTLNGTSATAVDLRATLALGAAVNGTTHHTVSGRLVGSNDYGAHLKLYTSGQVHLQLTRSGTALAGGQLSGLTYRAGDQLKLRLQVEGTSPTTLRAKVWAAGGPEPSTWQYVASDATAALQTAGQIRISSYLSSSATNGPAAVRWDDLAVTRLR